MDPTTTSVTVIRKARKRRRSEAGPAATITITCTTTRARDGWMHQLEARSADELRQFIAHDLDEVVQQVWPAP
jgi:hypothetical protein